MYKYVCNRVLRVVPCVVLVMYHCTLVTCRGAAQSGPALRYRCLASTRYKTQARFLMHAARHTFQTNLQYKL